VACTSDLPRSDFFEHNRPTAVDRFEDERCQGLSNEYWTIHVRVTLDQRFDLNGGQGRIELPTRGQIGLSLFNSTGLP
jgi:hypothetical protein